MSRPEVYVKYEENAAGFTYHDGGWVLEEDDRWSGGRLMSPVSTTRDLRGAVDFTFRGTSVAFIGNTPSNDVHPSQYLSVSIDGDDFYHASYADPTPPSYRQWYQSPILPDGEHTIRLFHIIQTSLDYAIVTAGESTQLQEGDALVVVDDDDTDHFMFVGDWTRYPAMFNTSIISGMPFQNATRRSRTAGDQVLFRFAGTSVSLYGIFSWPVPGSITANYAIDGASPTELTYSGGPSSDRAGLNDQPNFLLFQSNELTAGEHTLVMTITDVNNQTLVIDYATYKPSFTSVVDMPDFGGPFTSPTVVNNPDGESPGDTNSSGSGGIPVGVLIGAVVGGLALIAIGVVLWWLIRRRRLNDKRGPGSSGGFPMPSIGVMSELGSFSEGRVQPYQAREEFSTRVLASTSPFQPGLSSTKSQITLSPPADTAGVAGPVPSTISQQQAELRAQIQELENRIRQLTQSGAVGASTSRLVNSRDYDAEILRLQREIEELRGASPPAYDSGDQGVGAVNGFVEAPAQPEGDDAIAPSHHPVRRLPVPEKRPL